MSEIALGSQSPGRLQQPHGSAILLLSEREVTTCGAGRRKTSGGLGADLDRISPRRSADLHSIGGPSIAENAIIPRMGLRAVVRRTYRNFEGSQTGQLGRNGIRGHVAAGAVN